ncbi:MAG: DUF4197 domain-containing protein [Pseudomonadota bacterium]
MGDDREYISRRALVLRIGAGVGVCAAAPSTASAQEWWRRGASILEQLGVLENAAPALTDADAAAGLREALSVGVDRVIARVGVVDGYLLDNAIRIPLPGYLGDAQRLLGQIGFSYLLDDLETRLNRGAERAAPLARDIFRTAITDMSVVDAVDIVRGGDTAATDYFRGKMTPPLQTAFRPILSEELDGAGATAALDNLVDRYSAIPLAPQMAGDAKGQLIDHGLDYALRGVFYYLGKEEAAIRQDPAKRTSEILRKVFG